MKIEYVVGDLLTTEITYIAHGCNAKGITLIPTDR